MNVLVLSDAFWPDHYGGITKSLVTEVEGLVERGHDVVVASRRLDDDDASHERREGYELYRYDSPPQDSALYHSYPLFSLGKVPRLLSRLDDRYDFDVAYVHNTFQAAGVALSSADVPAVTVFHAPIPREIEIDADQGKYGWKTPFVRVANRGFKRLEGYTLRDASVVVTRSGFMTGELDDLYGNVGPLREIPLAVDTDRFEYVADPTDVRDELDLPEDRPILLTVRRLVARMGLENLVDAMETVTERHPDALLLIGGKGYLEETLREQIAAKGLEENVRLLGFVAEEDLPTYYGAADFFVMPTEQLEGFGLSTLESLSTGTPVVATPVGGNPQVVGPLDDDLVCDGTDPDAIAENLCTWLDRDTGTGFRENCREYCVSRFSVDEVASSLEATFEDAIERT
ncbi:glycosyltransferase family 4 protein [Halomicrococcus sp. SG-WS-1]|uniref:glycosyltransferase family 4 protein n=1 Tax=Halomicrococcus sp. SG-WS-1 TaxID=3439057 RepID=UPI003F79A22C